MPGEEVKVADTGGVAAVRGGTLKSEGALSTSMPMTADRRIALQDEDQGDPESDVYVREGSRVTHYHRDADCRTLRPPYEPIERSAA